MPSGTWILALVELIYYTPTIVPVSLVLWKHRRVNIHGWLFLLLFVILQITGSGMAVGSNGSSVTAVIIAEVGLSPLLLSLAGVIKECADMVEIAADKRARRRTSVVLLLYHFFVAGAIALYAVGAAKQPSTSGTRLLAKIGIILLIVSWVVLVAGIAYLYRTQTAITASRPLLWGTSLSCALLLVRIVYQCVATFEANKQEFSPISGSIVFKVVLQFLPGALILAAMVTGGIMTIELATSDRLQAPCFDDEHKLRQQV